MYPRSTLERSSVDQDTTYVSGAAVLRNVTASCYTLNNLFDDCAQRGRKLLQDQQTNKPHALTQTLNAISFEQGARIGKKEIYQDCFHILTQELEEAAATLIPIAIPNFGTFGYRMYNLGISIPYFDLNPKYADLNRLSSSSTSLGNGKQNQIQRLNITR